MPDPQRVAADVQAPVQVVHDVDQADRVHVEHRRRVGIVAHLRRIAGDADQIVNAQRRRAQQVRLHAQHIAVAAGVVQDGFDADFLLHQQRQRLVAHARRGPRAVRNIDRVHAHRFQETRAFNFLADIGSLGRDNLHHGHEFAGGDLRAQLGPLFQRHGRRSVDHGLAFEPWLGLALARASPTRKADFMTRMCSGVVPQHPPTRRTPAATNLRA